MRPLIARTYSAGCIVALGLATPFSAPSYAAAQDADRIPGGVLRIVGEDGQAGGACPLKHTDVEADIAGFVSRVTVRQTFYNPLDRKIEAVYVFPLPQDAAVDDMVMTVGDRRVVGLIKPRGEAREIYEAALSAGHVAGLLDQERPNIFTQSVANIEPGVEVVIEISYVETLKYDEGVFEWVFPMVVGPRYIPGGGSAQAPMTTGQATPQVPDGHKITPPVTPQGTRAGHDISLRVRIDGGSQALLPYDVKSELHEIDILVGRGNSSVIFLKKQNEIPNRDFVLRYKMGGDEIGDAFLVHRDQRGSFFTLILQPPRRIVPADLVPRELIFVLDTSGSMRGFPIEKAKKVMSLALDAMQPHDTFNMITFAGDTHILWEAPRANTAENLAEAQGFLESRRGGGGTEMMKAINAALGGEHDPNRLRVVCFMTDGYVGNDMAIIGAVEKNAGTTRVFSFGIGSSVNRFLLDGMAHAGRGEVEYVTLASQGDAAAERFHERVLAPLLTDIEIDWGELPVADVYPKLIPDLFSAKPIMIHGRLTGPASGTITLRGNAGDGAFERAIFVSVPQGTPESDAADHPALASLWARAKVSHLMMQDMTALQTGNFSEALKSEITELGVEFRLMTQFTSFVAVEEMTVTVGGKPTRINVPVEMPEGVSYEGVFGDSSLGMKAAGLDNGGGRGFGAGAPMHRSRGRVAHLKSSRRERLLKQSGGMAGVAPAEADRDGRFDEESATPASPADKLATPLRDLAAKVAKEGKDGELAVGKLRVIKHRVDVMVYLSDTSEGTLAALKKLGFVQTGEAKTTRLLIGTIDVRKLLELAKLEAVLSIRPVVAP